MPSKLLGREAPEARVQDMCSLGKISGKALVSDHPLVLKERGKVCSTEGDRDSGPRKRPAWHGALDGARGWRGSLLRPAHT